MRFAFPLMGYMPDHAHAVEKRIETGRKLLKEASTTHLPDSTRIEFWKYNPATLAKEGFIDPLSMVLIYKEHLKSGLIQYLT